VTARAPEPATSICTLRITLPERAWIRVFSETHPDRLLEITSHLDMGRQGTLVDLRIYGAGSEDLQAEIEGHPGVTEVELIHRGKTFCEYRIVHTVKNLLQVQRDLQLVPRFPMAIRNGVATWVVVASELKHRELFQRLKREVPGVTIESIHPADREDPLDRLTPRQRELFTRAMAKGYYEVPRKINLTDMAGELGITKSTLSEILATAEKKLLAEFQDRPGA